MWVRRASVAMKGQEYATTVSYTNSWRISSIVGSAKYDINHKQYESQKKYKILPSDSPLKADREKRKKVSLNIIKKAVMQPRILPHYPNELRTTIEQGTTIQHYESLKNQSHLLKYHNSPTQLRNLQSECRLLSEKLRGNSLLK